MNINSVLHLRNSERMREITPVTMLLKVKEHSVNSLLPIPAHVSGRYKCKVDLAGEIPLTGIFP